MRLEVTNDSTLDQVVAPSAAPEFAGTEALPSLLGRSNRSPSTRFLGQPRGECFATEPRLSAGAAKAAPVAQGTRGYRMTNDEIRMTNQIRNSNDETTGQFVGV